MYFDIIDSPVGKLLLAADEIGLCEISFLTEEKQATIPQEWIHKPVISSNKVSTLSETAKQLRAYFAGELKQFDLPLHVKGTDFQLRVWNGLCDIPYAETISYGELAANIGNKKACRAVGGANNRNPITIVQPCHRVIGGDGKLVGYGGGLSKKTFLLELEAKYK